MNEIKEYIDMKLIMYFKFSVIFAMQQVMKTAVQLLICTLARKFF